MVQDFASLLRINKNGSGKTVTLNALHKELLNVALELGEPQEYFPFAKSGNEKEKNNTDQIIIDYPNSKVEFLANDCCRTHVGN